MNPRMVAIVYWFHRFISDLVYFSEVSWFYPVQRDIVPPRLLVRFCVTVATRTSNSLLFVFIQIKKKSYNQRLSYGKMEVEIYD